ncbi:MAG: metallophosphoesterase family protein [Desulfovibrio sp.]|nr:metallophosphoesterase family protein [Desulfovibrio sp.]
MTLLGFKGVHPLMVLFFPLAAAAVLGGFWLLKRCHTRISTRLRHGYYWIFGLLCLAGVIVYPLVASYDSYRVLYFVCTLACFGALNAALGAALLFGYVARPHHHVSSRRRFMAGGMMAAAGSLVSMAGVDAATGEGREVADRRITVKRHPDASRGRELRVSLVSDLHAGFFLPTSHLQAAMNHIVAFKPDVVLFGGDLVEYELSALDETESFFRQLAGLAPVYAVIGNHDCYIDADAVAAFHRGNGVTPLRGEAEALQGPWGRFTLLGLRDVMETADNWQCALEHDLASTIMLVHNPQTVLDMPAQSAPWLSLSGHTHGGQMRLPLTGTLINQADRRIVAGLNAIDGRRIAVTAGLGYSGLPVRLLCPPDVTNLVIS